MELPQDKTELVSARFHAASAAEHLFAAYWAADRDAPTAEYLLGIAHEQFAKLALIMGYTIKHVSDAGDAAAYRARQMNAELPQATRDVLALKGMI